MRTAAERSKRTFLALIDKKIGIAPAVYPRERARHIASYKKQGYQVIGEFSTHLEALDAVRKTMLPPLDQIPDLHSIDEEDD